MSGNWNIETVIEINVICCLYFERDEWVIIQIKYSGSHQKLGTLKLI